MFIFAPRDCKKCLMKIDLARSAMIYYLIVQYLCRMEKAKWYILDSV